MKGALLRPLRIYEQYIDACNWLRLSVERTSGGEWSFEWESVGCAAPASMIARERRLRIYERAFEATAALA